MFNFQFLKNKITLSAVALVAVLAGCSSSPTPAKVDFDQNTEISTLNYKTFAWLTQSKIVRMPQELNPVMKARIDDAIEDAFIKRGYQLVADAETADFTISYSVGSRDKVQISSYPASYHSYRGWGRGYYGGGVGTETRVRNYTEGSLAIDIFDVESRQPVWHGWATKRVSSRDKDREEAIKEIKVIVDDVVAQFK